MCVCNIHMCMLTLRQQYNVYVIHYVNQQYNVYVIHCVKQYNVYVIHYVNNTMCM